MIVLSLLSRIFLKCTSTAALVTLLTADELCISWFNLFNLIQLALNPKMNNILSIRLLLPEPLGPTIDVKFLWKGPIFWVPAYDLKFFKIIWSMISLGLFSLIRVNCFLGIEMIVYCFGGICGGWIELVLEDWLGYCMGLDYGCPFLPVDGFCSLWGNDCD